MPVLDPFHMYFLLTDGDLLDANWYRRHSHLGLYILYILDYLPPIVAEKEQNPAISQNETTRNAKSKTIPAVM